MRKIFKEISNGFEAAAIIGTIICSVFMVIFHIMGASMDSMGTAILMVLQLFGCSLAYLFFDMLATNKD